jgi:hypothetical protein
MKQLRKISVERLDSLSSQEKAKLYGGIPPITPTPSFSQPPTVNFSIPPMTTPPPYRINPTGVGITYSF